MAGDKTYITDGQGKLHRATRVHAVTPTDIVWSSNPNDYTVQVKIDGKWHRAVLTMDAGSSTFFDNINIDKALVTGADGKQHTALIVKPESTVTLSDIKTDTHGTIAGTTTGETAVSTYSENWSNVKWQDNVNVYKVLVTGSDGKVHTALLTTSAGSGTVQVIVLGTSPLLLPDAVAHSLQYVKAFGGTEQRLPADYTQLEYIEASGTQYIRTGILPTSATKVEAVFLPTDLSTTQCLIGARNASSGSDRKGFAIWQNVGSTMRFDYQSDAVSGGTPSSATWNTVIKNARQNFLNDTQLNTNSAADFVCDNDLVIFGINTNGSTGSKASGRIKSVKIWKNGTDLSAYFVPAKRNSDNAIGMYDMLSGVFFANSGTGDFTAGATVTAPTPDAPMDIVSNNGVIKYTKNLLDMATENIVLGKYINNSGVITDSGPNFYNSKYIPVVAGETYTWSTSSSINYFSVMEYGSDYAFKKRTLFSNAGTSGSITLRSDTAFVLIGSNMDGTDVTLDKVAAVDWQFEKGSSATAYKPYSPTGIYTDGTVETIEIHGKNLINQNLNVVGKGVASNGSETTAASIYARTAFIKVLPNTTYTMSGLGIVGSAFSKRGAEYSSNNFSSFVKSIEIANNTFTTSANTNFVCLNTVASETQQMLEQGSAATTYEPYYNGGTATAEMLLRLGGAVDEQEILTGAITRKVKVIVFDGTESFTASTAYGKACIIQTASGIWGANRDVTPICTHFLGEPKTDTYKPDYTCFFNSSGHFYFRLEDNTVATFKAWLAAQYAAGTPVMVLVALATPTTESVAGQTLQVQTGDNTLEITQASLSDLELEAEYTKVA